MQTAQWNRMGRIRLFQNGCSQSSRFPTAGQEERRPWNEIGLDLVLLTTLPLREGGGVEAVAAWALSDFEIKKS